MKKLSLAIIGQGRSGKNIHGKYYLSEDNLYYDVKYVVEADAHRRAVAKERHPDCTVLTDYTELFDKTDVDLVVNTSFSDMHFPITRDLLTHGFNVMCEKPLAANRYECDVLINLAKEKGVLLCAFQQTFYAPFYNHVLRIMEEKTIGDITQVSIRYNGFTRRWDWQTLQKKTAGSAYNTGPHPIGMALGVLGFDENTCVAFSRLVSTPLTSGDADDYCKLILVAPDKPVVDVEICSTDAYSNYNIKLQGTRGTFKCTPKAYEYQYIVDGENPERPVVETFLADAEGKPIYCSEKLVKHEEKGTYNGTAFDIGTAKLYEELYYAITEGKKMTITAETAKSIIGVIEQIHADNPLPVKF